MTITAPTNGTLADATTWPTDVTNLLNTYVPNPANGFHYFNDFISTVNTGTGGADVVAQNSGTGAASAGASVSDQNRIGVVQSTTGTTATGYTGVGSGSTAIRLGGGTWSFEAAIYIGTLSSGTERYQLAVGFIDSLSASNKTDGAYLLYDDGGVSTGSAASANWQAVTCSNSTRTFTTTSTAVAATTWIKLGVEVNAAATSVVFKINGTTVATHATNIPTGASRQTGFGWTLVKSVGTTARTVDVDYVSVAASFTSAR